MKKFVLPAAVALAVSASAALAVDLGAKMPTKAPPPPPSAWDLAFGAAVLSDYNFRGISQTARGPGGTAYFEPRYNFSKDLQGYFGIQAWTVDLATKPSAEVDLYAGIRPTFGPLALDFGFIYYWYPKELQINGTTVTVPSGATTLKDSDYWEVYAKATYTFNEALSVTGDVFYSPDWLNTGADGTFASVIAKYNLPSLANGVSWYVSGELGRYWLGRTKTDPIAYPTPINLPDYSMWDVGVAFAWKVFTLDLRYYDTDLSKPNCFILTADPKTAMSNWCGPAFVAKLAADLTLDNLK